MRASAAVAASLISILVVIGYHEGLPVPRAYAIPIGSVSEPSVMEKPELVFVFDTSKHQKRTVPNLLDGRPIGIWPVKFSLLGEVLRGSQDNAEGEWVAPARFYSVLDSFAGRTVPILFQRHSHHGMDVGIFQYVCGDRDTSIYHVDFERHGVVIGLLEHESGRRENNRFEQFNGFSNNPWPLALQSGISLIFERENQNHESAKARNSSYTGNNIEPYGYPDLPTPLALFVGLPLFFLGAFASTRGLIEGPSWLHIGGWLIMVAGGLIFILWAAFRIVEVIPL